jgi:formylglycine-generating enzyme required for sulfatase activity
MMKTKFFFSAMILFVFVSVSMAQDATDNLTEQKPDSVYYVDFTDANTGADMVFVEGGTFTMGCAAERGGECYDNEKPARSVTLGDFYIGRYEVTQKQWAAIMNYNPSVWRGDSLPVENVHWDSVKVFIEKLNAMNDSVDWEYRLPTEAEWEYAARGGAGGGGYAFSGGGLDEAVWYDGNSGGRSNPVGSKAPNVLGIYDMSGNVWELVGDWYGDYEAASQTDPTGPAWGTSRVMRGGGWSSAARACRVSQRMRISQNFSSGDVGFRLVMGPKKKTASPQSSQPTPLKPARVKTGSATDADTASGESIDEGERPRGYAHKWEKGLSVGIGGFYGGDYGGGIVWANREEVAMPYGGGGAYLFADAVYAEVFAGYSGGGGKWKCRDAENANGLPQMSRSYLNVGALLKFPVYMSAGSGVSNIFPLAGIDYEASVSGKIEHANGNVYEFGKKERRHAATALSALWLKFGFGFNVDLIQNVYLRSEILYGFRTANAFEKSDAGLSSGAEPRQGHGLTCRVGAGVKIKELSWRINSYFAR